MPQNITSLVYFVRRPPAGSRSRRAPAHPRRAGHPGQPRPSSRGPPEPTSPPRCRWAPRIRSPGEVEDPPGQVKDSPGQVEDSPGQVEDALGQVEDAPGQVKDAPGQVKDSPGQVEDAPGQVEDAPGQVEDSPGGSFGARKPHLYHDLGPSSRERALSVQRSAWRVWISGAQPVAPAAGGRGEPELPPCIGEAQGLPAGDEPNRSGAEPGVRCLHRLNAAE